MLKSPFFVIFVFMKSIKIFSYGTLYQSGIQMIKFGQRFKVDDDLDYIEEWEIINVKVNGITQNYAVEGDKHCVVMGAIVHIPEELISKVDDHEGPTYKRIGVITTCGNDCQMYVKR